MADDKTDQMAKLKKRLSKLEKEIAKLKKRTGGK